MTATVVASWSGQSVGDSVDVTLDETVTDGDLAIVAVSAWDTGTFAPDGWDLLGEYGPAMNGETPRVTTVVMSRRMRDSDAGQTYTVDLATYMDWTATLVVLRGTDTAVAATVDGSASTTAAGTWDPDTATGPAVVLYLVGAVCTTDFVPPTVTMEAGPALIVAEVGEDSNVFGGIWWEQPTASGAVEARTLTSSDSVTDWCTVTVQLVPAATYTPLGDGVDDPVDPVFAAPTDGALWRVTEVMPAPTLTDGVPQAGWTPTSVTEAVVGWQRVIVDGDDVTAFRGAQIYVEGWEHAEPFGSGPATLVVPKVTPLDTPGTGALSWLRAGAQVSLLTVDDEGTVTHRLWAGEIASNDVSLDESSWSWSIECIGAAWRGDLQVWKPPAWIDPTDIGELVADALNSVIGRGVHATDPVTTGIEIQQRGSSDSYVLGRVQELLALGVTSAGNQWTVIDDDGRRDLTIRLKDLTTVDWTVRAGTRGISIRLRKDATEHANALYGRWVAPDGRAGANWKFPYAHPDTAPAYPNTDPGDTLTLGDNDADTDSGDGVTTWQTRANDLGFRVTVNGTLGADDIDAVEDIQRKYRILVDGIIGPQTWAATFAIGSNVGDLTAYRLPLIVADEVEPWRYGANGAIVGDNDDYDPTVLRVERDIDFGAGITRKRATAMCKAEYARSGTPKWVGTITLRTDPVEGPKWLVRAGENIRVQSWAGGSPLLHIARVQSSIRQGTVTLTVDEGARDAVTVGAILERDRQTVRDPARRPGSRSRRSTVQPDTIIEFDDESPCGRIPKCALYGDLWTVLRIPMAQSGTIVKTWATTYGPASKFAMAVFGRKVTASTLVSLVGNPLATPGGGYSGPWDEHADDLEDLGLIEAWGQKDQACGYYPGNDGATSLTGRHVDKGSLSFEVLDPPWAYVAFYADISCWIRGRFLLAPGEF